MKWKFWVLINLSGFGKVQHAIWAATKAEARKRLTSVYPRKNFAVIQMEKSNYSLKGDG